MLEGRQEDAVGGLAGGEVDGVIGQLQEGVVAGRAVEQGLIADDVRLESGTVEELDERGVGGEAFGVVPVGEGERSAEHGDGVHLWRDYIGIDRELTASGREQRVRVARITVERHVASGMRFTDDEHHEPRRLVRLCTHLERQRMPTGQGALLTEAADLIVGKDTIEVHEVDPLRHGPDGDEEQGHEHQSEEGVLVAADAEEALRLLHATDHHDRREYEERDGRHEPGVEVGDKLRSLVGIGLEDRRDGAAREEHMADEEVANEDGAGDDRHGQQQGVEDLQPPGGHKRGEQKDDAEQQQAEANAHGYGTEREVLCQ